MQGGAVTHFLEIMKKKFAAVTFVFFFGETQIRLITYYNQERH